jgi:putative glutamine amidotransferase
MSNSKKMNHQARKPVVLMSMGAQERGGHDYQVMTKKYMAPLVEISGCLPLLAPTCFGTADIDQYLSMVDGVYLTGAGTNIDPSLYGQDNLTPQKVQDRGRDLFDIPLIERALERGLPLFAICRGMQEWNIACGGDIHQKVYALPGFNDHRENGEAPVPDQYAPAHLVRLVPETWLSQLISAPEFAVNSLHGQGIKTLGKGLQALAHSPDGLIEAVYAPGAEQFTLGVQWHPEWMASQNPQSIELFTAFGQACRERVAQQLI